MDGGASQVAGAAGSAAKELAKGLVNTLVFGSFNPEYNKEDQKRMRYIQQKYAQAYGTKGAEDPETTIKNIDPNSRLLMMSAGRKPCNPFPHERAFEESLQMTFHPIPGHEGRFAASHAMACIAKITEYQVQRRKRTWIPGVQSPGRPNDYLNLFLDEMKTWMRTQLTLNVVVAEEMERREVYLTKLKHDNYYWAFPMEGSSSSNNKKDHYAVHDVIDFVHNKVLNALEVVTREEKNKSLQSLFKDLNDHTTNAFEYGKSFLAYLLTASKKAGADLTSSNRFDGDTYETGRLHRLLEKTTDPVMKMYVADIRESDRRIEAAAAGGPAGLLANKAAEEEQAFYRIVRLKAEEGGSSSLFGSGNPTLVFSVTDPKGNNWVLRKRYGDFESLLKEVCPLMEQPDKLRAFLPPKPSTSILSTVMNKSLSLSRSGGSSGSGKQQQEGGGGGGGDDDPQATALGEGLVELMLKVLEAAPDLPEKGRRLLCEFFDVKSLYDPPTVLSHAESLPNPFLDMKAHFLSLVASPAKANTKETDRLYGLLKSAWGIEPTAKILEAHALLQRMAALLGLTLEINHFFVSMFGNTLAFSKLPLRDLLVTLKEVMANFVSLANELFKHACQLNADQKYQWHKNLQATENALGMVRHHVEKGLLVIAKIDTDHLDYEAQMRRLQDVTQRFTPLLTRLDQSLPMIQSELNLPTRTDLVTNNSSSSNPPQPGGGGRAMASPLLLDSPSSYADNNNNHNNMVVTTPTSAGTSRGGGALVAMNNSNNGPPRIEEVDTLTPNVRQEEAEAAGPPPPQPSSSSSSTPSTAPAVALPTPSDSGVVGSTSSSKAKGTTAGGGGGGLGGGVCGVGGGGVKVAPEEGGEGAGSSRSQVCLLS